ncbi:MAG: SpoIID/LytB domain-containing protein [Synechococcaceae cyanobacterium]|nr:SpoIID/LytB domain-containing protein [Synechococcaceae cyanobacterium]
MVSRSAAAALRLAPRLLLPLLLLSGGCRAEAPRPAAATPLHWPVPPPPPLAPEAPVLWVSLAARLGPSAAAEDAAAAALRLQAAGGTLTLVDATGRRFSAPELDLRWRRSTLAQPFHLRRRVLGPFASFESAEQQAQLWRAQGAEVVIARPRDWEVWGSPEAPLPAAASRLVDRREPSRLVPVLQTRGGPLSLEGPIRLEASRALRWNGGLHSGPFRLQADAHGGWTLLEQVPLERYLEGVLPHEIGADAPAAALAAQAVLARTWAVRNSHRFVTDGYHLCADTQCQVYGDPSHAGDAVRKAVTGTRGQVLTWQGQPIHAVYHATNGGVSAGFEEGWNGPPLAYLKAAIDAPEGLQDRFRLPLKPAALPQLLQTTSPFYGAGHPLFRWERQLTAARLARVLPAGSGTSAVGLASGLRVLQRGRSGRVLALEITAPAGRRVLERDAIRRAFRELPSTLFSVIPAGPGSWRLVGGGHGHGVGLSQAGAIDLARQGWSSRRILSHYYPGTELQPLGAARRAP